MKKAFTLTLSLLMATALALTEAKAATALEYAESAAMETATASAAVEITIKVTGQSVRVTGASGKTMEVYSITGAKVATVAIDANDKTVSLNLSRGWYIIKVGTVTRKVAIL